MWTGGSQPSSHLYFSLLLPTPFHFCSLPSPLFASRFCSVSGQRLIRPNPWQCLARCTASVMMASVHCDECVSIHALGRDGMQLMSLFIYLQLPDGAHQKECVSWHISLSLTIFSLPPFCLLSGGWLTLAYGLCFRSRMPAWGEGEGGETAKKADLDLWGSPQKSGGSLIIAVCVCVCVKKEHMCGWLYLWGCREFVNLKHKSRIHYYNSTFQRVDTFFSPRSLNHKNLVSGNNLPASALLAVGIDGQSISTGDNHSVSASARLNSYLYVCSHCHHATNVHGANNLFLLFQSQEGGNVELDLFILHWMHPSTWNAPLLQGHFTKSPLPVSKCACTYDKAVLLDAFPFSSLLF